MLTHETVWQNIAEIRNKSPLVHNITNYVVMNTTANALLAIGASPIMAHAKEEMEEMSSIAGALVINIGTLSNHWIESMVAAAAFAKKRGIPIVLDPVGAGASKLRTETSLRIIREGSPAVIRGNASEIIALGLSEAKTKGVDSVNSSSDAVGMGKDIARAHHCVVSISGERDYISDGETIVAVNNGDSMMPRVTGMGCTASALTGAFAAVNPNRLQAAANAMAVMGIAGELAAEKADGPGTLQLHFYDALYNLSPGDIEGKLQVV
jgi:hydroxyethylthiazole kinase